MPRQGRGDWDRQVWEITRELKASRIMRKITAKRVCQIAGIGEDALKRYESGTWMPDALNLRAWASALGYRLNYEIVIEDED